MVSRFTEVAGIEAHVLSSRGSAHDENEDCGVVWNHEKSGVVALVVSDGMGGHVAGRDASSMVVRTCLHTMQERDPSSDWPEVITRSVVEAHRAVRAAAASDPRLETMGATVAVALVAPCETGARLHVAHVGDTRVYLVRGRSLYRLTQDHSLVYRMVAEGLLDEADAFGHPDGNVLDRAVGQEDDLQVDLQPPLDLEPGDAVMVCSDGLHGSVTEVGISEVVARNREVERICSELHAAALARGGVDDVTIGIVRVPAEPARRRTTRIVG